MFPKPQNSQEEKAFRKEAYEIEKASLLEFYKSMGYPEDGLGKFLANSLSEYRKELEQDGLL